MISSFEFKNKRMLRGLLRLCGLEIIEDRSGIFTHKQSFRSECITFEKVQEVDLANLHKELKIRKYLLDGLNLRKVTGIKTRNDQLVANTFSLHREKIQAELNTDDTLLLAEQEEILDEGKLLIKQYGTVQAIPRQEILKKEFVRYYNGKSYKLVKKSKITNTFIAIDN